MRSKNRVELNCARLLPNGIQEYFRVIVMKDKKDAAINEYKRQGYSVVIVWEG